MPTPNKNKPKTKPVSLAPKSTTKQKTGRSVNSSRYDPKTGVPIMKDGQTDRWRQQNGDSVKPLKNYKGPKGK